MITLAVVTSIVKLAGVQAAVYGEHVQRFCKYFKRVCGDDQDGIDGLAHSGA